MHDSRPRTRDDLPHAPRQSTGADDAWPAIVEGDDLHAFRRANHLALTLRHERDDDIGAEALPLGPEQVAQIRADAAFDVLGCVYDLHAAACNVLSARSSLS